MKKPNILLLMTDQMRGDCMGIAGHPDVKTPHLDTLADQGLYFKNAYSPCPSCIPARVELHTGLSPQTAGRVGYQDGIRWNYPHTLAGELTKAGYYTHMVGKMHVHPLRSLQGFHNVDLHDGYLGYYRKADMPYYENQLVADDYFHWLKTTQAGGKDVTDTGLECNSYAARPWMYEEELHPTNWVSKKCIDFLRKRDRDMPFFMAASYVRPHAPLDAPQCYFDMYQNMTLRSPSVGDWDTPDMGGSDKVHNSCRASHDKELIRQQLVGYYACITHIDHQIERILQELNSQGESGNTIIIFTSDHGDELCDHGLNRKAMPYQGSTHIPMIISGASKYLEPCTNSAERLVALRDIMPTCLSIAGEKIPDTIEGKDMLKDSFERDYLHGEHSYGKNSNHFIVTLTDKYIWYSQSGREHYFDLAHDENETRDLINSSQHQKRIGELREILVRELSGREEGYSDGKKLIVGKTPQATLQSVIKT